MLRPDDSSVQDNPGLGLDNDALCDMERTIYGIASRDELGTLEAAGTGAVDKQTQTFQKAEAPQRAKGLRERVLHFTPSWFAVTMGTGVIATLLNLLGTIWAPYSHPAFYNVFSTAELAPSLPNRILRWPALVFLLLDFFLFALFTAAFTARYMIWPQVLPLTLKHPQKSLFIGCFPMSMITIISAISQLGTTQFGLGEGFTLAATGLWFVATTVSLIVAVGIPWSIMTMQAGNHKVESTTAALLLPIVPPITAAATGSVLVEALTERYPTLAFTVLSISYMVLGIGLPISLMVTVLYFQRLLLFQTPPREVVVSAFLPLGNHGQGGEAMLHLGQAALQLFPTIQRKIPDTGVRQMNLGVGDALYGAGLIGGLALWALGMWWWAIAILTFGREWRRKRISFNMGFHSFVFPLASLSILTARLAITLDSLALRVVYTLMTAATISLWTIVTVPTAIGLWKGSLLHAPCIADLPLDHDPMKKYRQSVSPQSSS